MSDSDEISATGEAPKKNLGQTFLHNYAFQEAETDWVVGGRLNKDFIERYLQDLLGEYDREFYPGIGEQFDIMVSRFDDDLAGGLSEENLKKTVGRIALASMAIACSAMPGAFLLSGD